MSTLNLGLQCVGLMLMREKGDDEAAKCNSLASLRETAKKDPNFNCKVACCSSAMQIKTQRQDLYSIFSCF